MRDNMGKDGDGMNVGCWQGIGSQAGLRRRWRQLWCAVNCDAAWIGWKKLRKLWTKDMDKDGDGMHKELGHKLRRRKQLWSNVKCDGIRFCWLILKVSPPRHFELKCGDTFLLRERHRKEIKMERFIETRPANQKCIKRFSREISKTRTRYPMFQHKYLVPVLLNP